MNEDCKCLKECVINSYNVNINIGINAENREQVELELWDILIACNQLPYEFETSIIKVGEYL